MLGYVEMQNPPAIMADHEEAVVFFQSEGICETSYRDRRGRYQNQKGIVLPKVIEP